MKSIFKCVLAVCVACTLVFQGFAVNPGYAQGNSSQGSDVGVKKEVRGMSEDWEKASNFGVKPFSAGDSSIQVKTQPEREIRVLIDGVMQYNFYIDNITHQKKEVPAYADGRGYVSYRLENPLKVGQKVKIRLYEDGFYADSVTYTVKENEIEEKLAEETLPPSPPHETDKVKVVPPDSFDEDYWNREVLKLSPEIHGVNEHWQSALYFGVAPLKVGTEKIQVKAEEGAIARIFINGIQIKEKTYPNGIHKPAVERSPIANGAGIISMDLEKPLKAGDKIRITVTSGGYFIGSVTVTIAQEDLIPPRVQAIEDRVFEQGTEIETIYVMASDESGNLGIVITGLPKGLSYDPYAGGIVGTPEEPGTYKVKIKASDQINETTKEFQIKVNKKKEPNVGHDPGEPQHPPTGEPQNPPQTGDPQAPQTGNQGNSGGQTTPPESGSGQGNTGTGEPGTSSPGQSQQPPQTGGSGQPGNSGAPVTPQNPTEPGNTPSVPNQPGQGNGTGNSAGSGGVPPVVNNPVLPAAPSIGGAVLNSPVIKKEDAGKDLKLDLKGFYRAYISGYPDGTFRPDAVISRAEGASMIARLAELDLSDDSIPKFKDTKKAWYNKVINAVSKKGLMPADEDGNFRPTTGMTRAEFARAIAPLDKTNNKAAAFSDIKGHKYEKEINQAYGNGRINGYPDGTFKPDNYISRAEAVKILNSLYNRVVKKEGLKKVMDNIIKFSDVNENYWAYYDIVQASNSHYYERKSDKDNQEIWTKLF